MSRKNSPKGGNRQAQRQRSIDNAVAEPESYNRRNNRRSRYDKHENCTGLLVRVEAKTHNQGLMLSHMQTNDIVVAIGPPGTGKTAVATLEAARMLYDGSVKQIILSRPLVEIGPTMGHLPGEVEEKYEPYLEPFREHLNMALGKSAVEMYIKSKVIMPKPINFIQGATWNDSVILIDEAQNLTPQQMFMLLTRVGKNSLVVITGDEKQVANDSLRRSNGLTHFLELVEKRANGVQFSGSELALIRFTNDDNVRSGVSRKVTMLYA